MLNWLSASITRTISGLSTVLLSFLFIVIVYSVFKLQSINVEMREVAEIDIPLTDVVSEIELLQMRQHLLMEKIRQIVRNDSQSTEEKSTLEVEFDDYDSDLETQLERAVAIIQTGLSKGRVRLDVSEHKSVLLAVNQFHQHRKAFEQAFRKFVSADKSLHQLHWNALEGLDGSLDAQSEALLENIESLTLQISDYTEKHEREFMLVNLALGVSALGIGLYLTLFVVQSFRKRVGSLQGQIETLQHSIHDPDAIQPQDLAAVKGRDELAELENDLRQMVARFSNEMRNRYEVEEQLMELATRDKLTGAFNRHKWESVMSEELALAQRGNMFSLIVLDVDRFKHINDSYGHDVGDKVLQRLVESLKSRLRLTDLLFRLGGEEFAVLLRHADENIAISVAEILREQIEQCQFEELPTFTISLGITAYRDGDSSDLLMKRADKALYAAKQAGRNQACRAE